METFPTELGILTCLMILAASLWIPYIVGVNKYEVPGAEDPFVRPTPLDQFPAWVHRAHRAHLNLIEQALPFSVLVLILNSIDGFTGLTYWTAIVFFWVRVLHAVGMIAGFAKMPLRPGLFLIGWLCCLTMAYAVFTAAL
ncbi:MAPEG family protein [Marivita hallyeonensis]|uniref:MAPEG family protein n=1 Tax=Marivita hallyeonensis TaxID=996342 RepID=A0A1M5P2K7_9RHOB|nr:MAPEG family protein [Marivita hallyeonensis]SHG96056.1 MAPEG family protein [Marivita hallyeonensis]